jgi:hypothetical protein
MSNKFVLVLGWFSLFCLPLHVGTFHVSVETGDDSNPGSPGRWTKEEKQPICGVGGSPIGRGKQLIGCTIFGYTDGILVGSSEDLLIQGHLDQGTDHVRVETLATPDLTTTSANITPTGQSVEAGGDVRIPAYSITRLIWR